MAKAREKLLLNCLVATLLLISMVEGADQPTICNIPLNKLEQCRPAVTGKHPPPPTKQCCSSIKHADLTCLCNFKDALPALKIDPADAFALPKKCKFNVPIPPQCGA